MRNKVQFTTWLEPEQKKFLDFYAATMDTTIAATMRGLVDELIEKSPEVLKQVKQAKKIRENKGKTNAWPAKFQNDAISQSSRSLLGIPTGRPKCW